jgi:hypothetical protein
LDLGQDIPGAELGTLLHELLETSWHQGDKLSPRLTIIRQSSEEVGHQAKGFPQGILVLSGHHQFSTQILNSFLDLHKIPVSSMPNQLGKGKLFFNKVITS